MLQNKNFSGIDVFACEAMGTPVSL